MSNYDFPLGLHEEDVKFFIETFIQSGRWVSFGNFRDLHLINFIGETYGECEVDWSYRKSKIVYVSLVSDL